MKIIVFGLGNFGASLAINLTETGNEVIGIDLHMEKVNLIKDKIAHAICMDATNELAYQSIPIKDSDMAVIAIGENEGAAIITTAIIKKIGNIKIIGRSLSPIHDTVLQAMGIDNIIHPEKESAERLTKKINLKSMVDNFDLDQNYSISEIKSTSDFEGKTLLELDFRNNYNLNIITILRKKERTSLLGPKTAVNEVTGMPTKDTIIQKDDILVVFGRNNDITKFCDH
jgi:trk system potassium uptake protein